MEKKKVLVFPAGAENAMEIYDSLRYNVNVEVFGASGKKDYAEYLYDNDHYIEGDFYYESGDFIEKFNNILKEYKIDVVIPTHDDIALYLAAKREVFFSKILISDATTALICRSKKKTYELFEGESFAPKIFGNISEISIHDYPVLLKPDKSSGGRGIIIIREPAQLEIAEKTIEYIDDNVICEYLPGNEITIDCFSKKNGNLSFVGARTRERVVGGIAYRSTTIPLGDDIRQIAAKINEKLNFFGGWYFQLKQDKKNRYKLLEISCRQSTGMTLYRNLGINFPLLGIFELYGIDTSYVLNYDVVQMERRLHTSFKTNLKFNCVYMDFDDTIIVNGRVCSIVIQFIYQCVDEGKKIVLLTRHEGELEEIMRKHRLSLELFDDVIHISFNESKADYIEPAGAILVDNSFEERLLISKRFNMPVYDVDAVGMLLKE